MDSFLHDLRSGLRILTKSPGPAAVAVVVLTLGIGLTTTMFSIVDGIVLQGLPLEDGDEIMSVMESRPGGGSRSLPIHDFVDWREQQTSFEDLSGFAGISVYLSDGEEAERYVGAIMSANAFAQLRVQPLLGSYYNESHDQPGAEPVVVLGYRVWAERYGSDPEIVGRSLLVNGVATTVLGVMPEGFQFPINQEVWIPLKPDPTASERGSGRWVDAFGRLRDGVDKRAAQLELSLIAKRLEETYPESNEGIGAYVQPYTLEYLGEDEHQLGYTCLGAVAFVLLIACSNVANLLLARTTARSKELALRAALGAGRLRVIRQVLAESFFLALPAAAFGLVLARIGVNAFNAAVANQNWPFWFDVKIDAVTLWMVLGLTLVTTLAAGLIPALRASRLDINAVLKDESRGAAGPRLGGLSKHLVVVEVALSCVLLIGAGLMVRSILKLADIDFAFRMSDTFVASVGLPQATYPEEAERLRFFERLHEELAEQPGIEKVALALAWPTAFPTSRWYGNADRTYPSDTDYNWSWVNTVTPGYFDALDVELLAGRDFNLHDTADSPGVAIVNQRLAELEWPGEDPLGKRLRLGRSDSEEPWLTVIGVVPDIRTGGLNHRKKAVFYRPMTQDPRQVMDIVAQTTAQPTAVAAGVRDIVRRLDRSLPVYRVSSLEQYIEREQFFFFRLIATIFSVLGAAALVLAAVGLYSVLAFSVSRRTAEVGIRMALGAAAKDVLRLIVGQGLRQVAVGLVLGLVLAATVANLMSSQIFGIKALDPVTFGVITLLLIAIGALSAWIPALRAMKVSPTSALRYE